MSGIDDKWGPNYSLVSLLLAVVSPRTTTSTCPGFCHYRRQVMSSSSPALKRSEEAMESTQKTAVTAIASLAPLYILLGIKNRVGLDQLHVGLLQFIFIILFRYCLEITRFFNLIQSSTQSVLETTTSEEKVKSSSLTRKKRRGNRKVSNQGDYSSKVLDETLHRFLAIVDPEESKKLPGQAPENVSDPLPLESWIHRQDLGRGVSVCQHPTLNGLYAITSHLPKVPLKKLLGLLVDVSVRPSWDSLTESAEQLQEVRDGQGRVASVSHMKMKGMWPVKPKDIVLLSVITRLPSTISRLPGSSPTEPVMRIVCASASVLHPLKPPQAGYTRLSLDISGFIAQEDGFGGCHIVQVTDLSGLGSVPNFVINTVTCKMIPASLRKVGAVALTYMSDRFPEDVKDESWIVPVIGDWRPGQDPEGEKMMNAALADDNDDEDEEEEGSGDPVEEIPLGQARDLKTLIAQLKLVTGRLAELEGRGRQAPNSRSWLGRWSGSSSSGQDQGVAEGWSIPLSVASVAVAAGATWTLIRNRRQ